MKKLSLLTVLFVLVLSVKTFAQNDKAGTGEFKPFKVDISVGYALPIGGTGAKGGVLFVVEPKYAVIPQVSIGLRLESAVTLAGTNLSSGYTNSSASAKASASYLLTGDHYFNNSDIRPFAGAGLGIFSIAGTQFTSGNTNIATGSKFGGMIRGGFEYKHLRMGVEYNIVSKSVVPPSSSSANDGYTLQNSYIGIKIGVLIGGGRR